MSMLLLMSLLLVVVAWCGVAGCGGVVAGVVGGVC